MPTDTGESTRSINARSDANAWPRVYCALTRGAILYRPPGMTRYYTKCKRDLDPDEGIGISANFVKSQTPPQAKYGCLILVGVDTYGLDKSRINTATPTQPAQNAVDPKQMGLFE